MEARFVLATSSRSVATRRSVFSLRFPSPRHAFCRVRRQIRSPRFPLERSSASRLNIQQVHLLCGGRSVEPQKTQPWKGQDWFAQREPSLMGSSFREAIRLPMKQGQQNDQLTAPATKDGCPYLARFSRDME